MRLADSIASVSSPSISLAPFGKLKGHRNRTERSLINGKDLATFEPEATERLIITFRNQGFTLAASMPRQRRQP